MGPGTNWGAISTIFIILLLLGLGGFFIYFFFKQIQFVLQAINLYKDILNREEMIIKLLKDILGKISAPNIKQPEKGETVGQVVTCPKCHKTYDGNLSGIFCENCGAALKT